MDHASFETKFTVGEDGTIEGIAWPYGSPDRAGDIITKGAIRVPVSDLPMLRGHDPDALIGLWTEVKETDAGLMVRGQLNLKSPLARGTRSQILTGQYTGLSIAWPRDTVKARRQGRHRIISSIDLIEISVVRSPSHPGARITSAKSNPVVALAEAINRAAAAIRGA